jgi:hypothetical protein
MPRSSSRMCTRICVKDVVLFVHKVHDTKGNDSRTGYDTEVAIYARFEVLTAVSLKF